MYMVLNILIFLSIVIFIIYRYHKFRLIQLNDFILIFYALFFPLGLIRPILGYESVIGYNILEHETLLSYCSFLALVGVSLFMLGSSYCCKQKASFLNKSNVDHKRIFYRKSYIRFFEIINLIISVLVIYVIINFIRSHGSIIEYFSAIDSIRQTLSGQMQNFLLIYLNVLLAVYIILVKNGISYVSLFSTFISIIAFSVYGFRGPVIVAIIILFLALQKIGKFKIKFDFKNIFIFTFIVFLFVLSQELRTTEVSNAPVFIKILKRFNGYESFVIIFDKVVVNYLFEMNTFLTNLQGFFELPIPRSMYVDKVAPASLLLSKSLFYDIGVRSFETGGISPTILGSLIWNFHIVGIFVMFFIGMAGSYLELLLRESNSSLINLLSIYLSIYLILSVEAPENSLGVLWLLSISWIFIAGLSKLFTKRTYYKTFNHKSI